jgi:hypothetical protein
VGGGGPTTRLESNRALLTGVVRRGRATLLHVRVYLLLECVTSLSFVLQGCQASSAGFQTVLPPIKY